MVLGTAVHRRVSELKKNRTSLRPMIGSGGAILKCAHGDVLPTSVEAAESAKPRRGDGVISVDAAKTKTIRASRPAEAVVVKTPLLAVRRRRD